MRLYTKEDDIYINIPSNMINNIDEDNILLKEYIHFRRTKNWHLEKQEKQRLVENF